MYTTRDVYGNPRFIIHFLDLVHEDHPGDHVDKMESARRMANKHGGGRETHRREHRNANEPHFSRAS